jgi:hypothetical protein
MRHESQCPRHGLGPAHVQLEASNLTRLDAAGKRVCLEAGRNRGDAATPPGVRGVDLAWGSAGLAGRLLVVPGTGRGR